jgi:hypothetical protein
MSTFLYAAPMLKQAERTWMATASSGRPTSWATINEYNNEYLAIPDMDVLSNVFNVFEYRAACDPQPRIPTSLWGTIYWGQTGPGPLPISELMSRPKFEKWLYFIFFRLAIPYYRDTAEAEYPLNLTIFFRLMASLPPTGYPMTWLHTVMIRILENTVLTTTRPPRSCPLALDELELDHPQRRVPTAPFAAEMRTLASLYQRLLPFILITETLSPPDQIFEYTIKVTFVEAKDNSRPGLVLVFVSDEFTEIAEHEGEIDLHSMLVFEPSALPKEQADSVLEVIDNGVMIVTTFKLDHAQKSAVLWMKGDVIENMVAAKNWRVGLWRTDDWQPIATPGRLNRKRITKGESWLDTPALTEAVGRYTQMPPVIPDEPKDHGKKKSLGLADAEATLKDPAEGGEGSAVAALKQSREGEKTAGTIGTPKDAGKKAADITNAPKDPGEKRADTIGAVKDSGNKRADVTGDTIGTPKDSGLKRADTMANPKDHGDKCADTVGTPDASDADIIALLKQLGGWEPDTIGTHKEPSKEQDVIVYTPDDLIDSDPEGVGGPTPGARPREPGFFFL